MNLFDSSELRLLKDAILDALRVGQAEEPEEEAAFILRYLNRRSPLDHKKIDTVLSDLTNGVSPYHVIGEYPIPGARNTLIVPHEVMPPGSDTPGMTSAVQGVARYCTPTWLADIGCGIGILGIAALLASPDSQGIFIDLDTAACEAASANLARLELTTRAAVVRGDGLACLAPGSLDLVVANLPFVPTNHIASLPPRFSRHAPRRAVDGGRDGLDLFRRLLPQVRHALLPAGCVVLQVGTGQKGSIVAMLGSDWEIASRWTETYPNLIVAIRMSEDRSLDLSGSNNV